MLVTIDKRIDESKYFFFPGETKYEEMNCFELSTAMYLALKEIYPESKPELVFVDDKSTGGVHAMAFFTHNNRVWCADPNYLNFGEIDVSPNKINVLREKKTIDFKSIRSVSDDSLMNTANALRQGKGIVDFVRDGQILAEVQTFAGDELLYSHYMFGYINPRTNRFVTEIRDFPLSDKRNSCLRLTSEPEKGVTRARLFSYSERHWRRLKDQRREKVFPVSSAKAPVKWPGELLRDYTHFLRHPKKQEKIKEFIAHKNFIARFGDFAKEDALPAKDLEKEMSYFDFLKHHFGSAENIKSPKDFAWPNPGQSYDSWSRIRNKEGRENMRYLRIAMRANILEAMTSFYGRVGYQMKEHMK